MRVTRSAMKASQRENQKPGQYGEENAAAVFAERTNSPQKKLGVSIDLVSTAVAALRLIRQLLIFRAACPSAASLSEIETVWDVMQGLCSPARSPRSPASKVKPSPKGFPTPSSQSAEVCASAST